MFLISLNRILFLVLIGLLGAGAFACKSTAPKGRSSGSSNSPLTALSPELRDRMMTLFVEGSTKHTQGKLEEAYSEYESALRIAPEHGPTLYFMARIRLEQEKLEEGEGLARRAVAADPTNFWYPRLHADALNLLGRSDEAAKVLAAAVKRFPEETDLNLQLAESYIAAKDYENALKVYDGLENQSGLFESVLMQKKQLYQTMNQPEMAIQQLQRLVDRSPQDPRFFYELHDMYLANKQNDKARETVEKLLLFHPDDPIANFKSIDYLMMRGEKDAALQQLRRNIDNATLPVEPKVEYLFRLLQTPQFFNEKVLLVGLSERLDRVHPKNAMVHSLRGDLYSVMGRNDSARYFYRQSLRFDPTNEKAWEAVLLRDSELKMPDSLLADSRAALELFPNNATLLYFNGLANYQHKKYDAAIYAFDKFLKFDSPEYFDPMQAYLMLADCYHHAGQFPQSDKMFDQALKISPSNVLVLNNYAYFLSVRNDRMDKALEMIEQVIAIEPNNPSYQDTYGWVLYQKGRYDDARQWIEKAYNNGGSADVTHHLGDVYYKLGQNSRAMELWKEARDKGTKDAELERKIATGQL